jgi:hypothetical protein
MHVGLPTSSMPLPVQADRCHFINASAKEDSEQVRK